MIISAMNATTIASDTIATPSVLRRRQASVHRPGDTVCGISRRGATGGFIVMSFIAASPLTSS